MPTLFVYLCPNHKIIMLLKRLFLLPTLLLFTCHVIGQQWISKKYSYDSTLDITYGSSLNFLGQSQDLKLDLYNPICGDVNGISKKPLVLFIHGGAFISGSKADASITALCKNFAQRGYVAASVGYRLGFISDENAWNCNYTNYSCIFATDTAEWIRAYYRGVQDVKGALRFLVNSNESYSIDTNNIFVAGESAGAFIAMGVAFMDTASERLAETFAITAAPQPHSQTVTCVYNTGKTFGNGSINRPDLGDINGNIAPTNIKFTIKGAGNIYGGMINNLLAQHKTGTPKPALYSFHQPCDLVVPFDSGNIFTGLSWCMANGYNCNRIANTPKIFGSRSISRWNTNNTLGYLLQDEFTATTFPFNFLFGNGSCADQINNPCHAYDNKQLRENNLAQFFGNLVSTSPVCDTGFTNILQLSTSLIKVYPNPSNGLFEIDIEGLAPIQIKVLDAKGILIYETNKNLRSHYALDISSYAKGVYQLLFIQENGIIGRKKIISL